MFTDKDVKPFDNKIWLSSPTMHGEENEFVAEAFRTNWMSTLGENIDEVERIAAQSTGKKYAVALCNCTSALHLCVRLAGERLYGKPIPGKGALCGKKVFCSDMTFNATVGPVIYEGGEPVFIDTDPDTWNMDPKALEKAFLKYPDVKLVVYAELYGFCGDIGAIKDICRRHGALLIEDAAEAMGAKFGNSPCGSFGDFSAISYNGNKIITGSSGGCLLTDSESDALAARKLSTQAKEAAPWYQHNEVGYNYRMSNVIAGIIRGQYLHLNEHIALKCAIYERYGAGLAGLPVKMNPVLAGTEPNFWLSALIIDKDAMCEQTRDELTAHYTPAHGKSCPTELLCALDKLNAEGRPIWKPMHLQPLYSRCGFIAASDGADCGADIFARGLCLPSDIKMTAEQQDEIIKVIRACFE